MLWPVEDLVGAAEWLVATLSGVTAPGILEVDASTVGRGPDEAETGAGAAAAAAGVSRDIGTTTTVVLFADPSTMVGKLALVMPAEPERTSKPERESKDTTVCEAPMTSPEVSVCRVEWCAGFIITSELADFPRMLPAIEDSIELQRSCPYAP